MEEIFADVRAFLAAFPPRSPDEIRAARVRILTEEVGELEYAEIARARIAGACGPTAGVLDPGACDSSDSSETE